MKVSVSLDDKEIKEMIKRFPRKIEKASKTAILRTAIFAELAIKRRTLSGKSSEGGSFTPYAKSTNRSRRKRGRNTGRVDLFDSGEMFGAIKSRAKNPFIGQVYFTSVAEGQKAMWHHHGRGKLPVRKWFDIAKSEEPLVINIFRNEFIKQMAFAKA